MRLSQDTLHLHSEQQTTTFQTPVVYLASDTTAQTQQCISQMETGTACVPLVPRLELGQEWGPASVRLGQVGAVVPGVMRVVIHQSHFLLHTQQQQEQSQSAGGKRDAVHPETKSIPSCQSHPHLSMVPHMAFSSINTYSQMNILFTW